MTAAELRALIRTIPDFPQPSILFRDVTTLIGHGEGFAAALTMLAEKARETGAEAIAGIEARGFIFGAPVAALDYALEYGTGTLEIDPDAIVPGSRVVVIDDLLATGGTALAATQLLRKAGAEVQNALFVIDLPDLGGGDRLRAAGLRVSALMDFAGH